jgi:predicted PurR-regulated permease PerM
VERISEKVRQIEDAGARLLMPAPKPASPAAPPAASARKSRKTALLPPPPLIAITPPGIIPEVRIHEDRNLISSFIYDRLESLYQFVLIAPFLPLLVYFMLSWRDHVYKSFLRFFDGPGRVTAARSLQGIAGMARAFAVGNFIIGILLAACSCVLFALIRLPYPFLIGSVSGLLSLVPYAGLLLALVPPALAALATGASSTALAISMVAVAAFHLIAMNVLYPTLVGARVHLNPVIVTLSLMFWGFLWGAAGLVLAVPIMAGVKAVCDNVPGLRNYGRFLGD